MINVRYIFVFSLFFLYYLFPVQVLAQDNTQCTYGSSCSLDQASSACLSFKDDNLSSYPVILQNCTHLPDMGRFIAHLCKSNDYCTGGNQKYGVFYYDSGCPSGTEWFPSENRCLQPCLDRNPPTPPNYGYWTMESAGSSMCKSGCSFIRGDVLERRTAQVCGSGNCTAMSDQVRTVWKYSGEKCSTQPNQPPPPLDDKEPSCSPAVSGQTYCITQTGDNCYTASTGRMICWTPTEPGTKPDGPVTQTNTNGNQAPNPPPGSTSKSTVNTTTTTNTNTNITTTNTYTTTSGAPAGSTNQGTGVGSNGKPNTGTGTGTGSGGTGTGSGGAGENGNTAGGGGDCKTPPITSGDAIAGMVATQTWATRCAVESGNSVKVTGDVGNCSAPYQVEGTNANAEKLRALRVQICGPDGVAANGRQFDSDASNLVSSGDGDEPSKDDPKDPFAGRKVERDGNWLINQLDNSGFLGAGSCPADSTVSYGRGSFTISLSPICRLLSAISGLVIALAYLIAFRIMAS